MRTGFTQDPSTTTPERLIRPYNFSRIAHEFPKINPNNKEGRLLIEYENQFSLSSRAPIAEFYRKSRQDQELVAPLFHLLNNLSNIIETRRESAEVLRDDVAACNLRDIFWAENMARQLMRRQFGILNSSCNSRIDVTSLLARKQAQGDVKDNENLEHFKFETVRTIILNVKRSVKRAYEKSFEGGRLIRNVTESNWKNGPFPTRNINLDEMDSQKCSMDDVVVVRNNSAWYLLTAITNYGVANFIPNNSREFIHEYVREDFSTSLSAMHPTYGAREPAWELSTTVLTRGYFGREGTGARQGSIGLQAGDFYSPLGGVFRRNAPAVDRANDAITASNVAILSLPMLMTVIPSSLVTDMTVFGMLLYAMATDIIGVLPFLIKGFELINASRERSEVVSYHLGDERLGLVRVFAVKCEGVVRFQSVGVAFVGVAFCAMVFGVCLEVFAWRVMKKRAQKKIDVEGDDYRISFASYDGDKTNNIIHV